MTHLSPTPVSSDKRRERALRFNAYDELREINAKLGRILVILEKREKVKLEKKEGMAP